MNVKAKLNNVRISPRKVRLVASLIRGMRVQEARTQLQFLMKKSSLPMVKLIDSALANAKHNYKLNPESLYVSSITVDEGPTLKRGMPRARGSVFTIRKRTSHIALTLSEKSAKNTQVPVKKGAAAKVTKEVKKKEVAVEETKEEKPKAAHTEKKSEEKKGRLTGISKRAFRTHEK
ncbi:50S ribosomal protein L22 [Candidatus Azambacteria bacterium RBG_16_47_10]|uniref:Large ribosomal subunit protein uL22 n=1 Tax=Candidatus Azambacteria bacterium RBG_16_47_10 TaxID=1797292 RepID=A0A1F5AY20_9BACT|nr:MAG: 50S ribosomal protein L22 [Candidatus Azambacteria bacterium RBG_16_47_10]